MQAAVERNWHRLSGKGAALAGALAAVAVAIGFARFVDPTVGLLVWALVITGDVVYRWPATAIVVALAMDSGYGSLKAFFHLPANGIATAVLVGMFAATLGALLFGRRRQAAVVWPGTVPLALYVAAVALSMAFAPNFAPALKVARTEGLYIFAALLLAYGPWKPGTHGRVRRAFVWIALIVGAYATLRWAIGASAKEKAQVSSLVYNSTAPGHEKVQGPFPSGSELGIWTSSVIPFLIATVLSGRGRIRGVALAALPLCVIGLLGSALRAGLVSTIAGTVVVLLLYTFAVSMPPKRPLVLIAVVGGMIAGGIAIFPQVVGHDPHSVQRYRNLLNFTQDASFQLRIQKWDQAFSRLGGHPFGFGLGTIGYEAGNRPTVNDVNPILDSSYVRIAYEQGVGVMVLFIASLVLILAGLVRRGVVTRDRARAGPAIAAAGTLVSAMVLMFTEMFTDAPCALISWIIVGLGMAPFTRIGRNRPAWRA